jgi:hypothetical protein
MLESGQILKLLKFEPRSLQQPNAWVGHMPFAYWLIETLRPAVFVELGTHTGNSYFSFCQSISENKTGTQAYAVDTWKGDGHAGFYEESVFKSVQLTNQDYEPFSTLLRTTFDDASEYFENKSIDLLHIDGLHTYEAVKHDFETWLPKMSNNGVILFHDTNVKHESFGVSQLWSELSQRYNALEFYHSNGLGILDLSPQVSLVIPDDESKKNELRELFSILSEKILTRFDRDSLLAERDSLLASGLWRVTRPIRNLIQKIRIRN